MTGINQTMSSMNQSSGKHVDRLGQSLSTSAKSSGALCHCVDPSTNNQSMGNSIMDGHDDASSRSQAIQHWQRELAGSEATSTVFPSTQASGRRHAEHEDMIQEQRTFPCDLSLCQDNIQRSTLIRAAWGLIAGRMMNSDDVVFGVATIDSPKLSTPQPVQPITYPARIQMLRDQTVSDYLQAVQRQASEMLLVPPMDLVEMLGINSEVRHACLFQTLLVISSNQNDQESHNLPSRKLDGILPPQEPIHYSLKIEAHISGPSVQTTAHSSHSALNNEVLQSLLTRIEYVVHQLSQASRNALVGEVNVVTSQDLEQIWDWNNTVPATLERCVHEMIQDKIDGCPGAQAICAWDGSLTYSELGQLSTALAVQLVNHYDLKAGSVIPLCFEKSMWTVVAMLAVLKSGNGFVLLDDSLPVQRLKAITEQINPTFILSSPVNETLSLQLCPRVWAVSSSSPLNTSDTSSLSLSTVSHDSTAWLMFTSGTTGTPKGVVITHRCAASSLYHQSQTYQFDQSSRIYEFSSYNFDMCHISVFQALTSGGCLCIPSDTDRLNRLAASMHEFAADTVYLTPSVARLISPDTVPMLKSMFLGGEAVRPSDVEPWLGKIRLFNEYGPSECTPCSTINLVTDIENAGNIGTGFGAVTWIVDPANHDRLLPAGAVGELILEGPLVGPGYLNNPEKTAQAYVRDPSWLLKGSGQRQGRRGWLYKTGDLVRYNPDGSIVYIGRKDSRVKIRGQQVDLEEVEHQVQRWVPGVGLCVAEVITPCGEGSIPILAAFAQLDGNSEANTERDSAAAEMIPCSADIKEKLAEHLPSYMIPRALLSVKRIPITVSGKTDRQKLREIGGKFTMMELRGNRKTARGLNPEPASNLERQMLEILSRVLKLPSEFVGLDENFLHLGGDSISAIRVVQEARLVGIRITVADLLQHPVIRDLTKHALETLDESSEEIAAFMLFGDWFNVPAFVEDVSRQYQWDPSTVRDAYPCTPLQEGIVSLALQRDGDYIAQHVIEVDPNINVKDVCMAWERVVAITPILRTRIVLHAQAGLVQVVLDEDSIHWNNSESLDEYLKFDKKKTMELGACLSRFAIVQESKAAGASTWLVWTVHHALVDGWSMDLIKEKVRQVFQGQSVNPGPQFQHFIKYLREQDSEKVEQYWKKTLERSSGEPFPSLPSSRYQAVTDSMREYEFPLPALNNIEITISTLIRAAWALVAGRMTSSRDVLFGTTVFGRNAPVDGIDSMVAPAFATVPLRVQLAGTQTVSEYLSALQLQSTEMIPFEQTGLHQIAKVSSDCHEACQFNTLLAIQPAWSQGTDDYGRWQQEDTRQQEMNTYPVVVQAHLGSKEITARIHFDSKVIDPWMVESILRQMEYAMDQLSDASNSSLKLDDVNTLTPEELGLLWERNRKVPETIDRCVHEVIREVAISRPNASAIEAWDGSFSYGELDRLSTGLAGQLTSSGVKTGMIIPVCFEKSVWTVVALLAVLKAGAAFVSIDAHLPKDRLQSIVNQVEAELIVCSTANQELCSQLVPKVITVHSSLWSIVDESYQDVRICLPCPSSTMYITFTSGSTGTPKGSSTTHRAMASALYHQTEAFGITPETRMYDFTTHTFDMYLYYVFATLERGGCLCVPDDYSRRYQLPESITALNANSIFLTPPVLGLLSPEKAPTLKWVSFGGEKLTLQHVGRWWGKAKLVHGYGPSECTPYSLFNESCESFDDLWSLGKGHGMVTWVIDPNDHDVLLPLGAVGELLLEGPLVGVGYLNNEEITAATFIQDPNWLIRGAPGCPGRHGRLYKTGDLVQYNQDGSFTFVGRKDAQVKLRGQRIELEEVGHWVQIYMKEEASQSVVEILHPEDGDGSKAILAAFLQIEDTVAGSSAKMIEIPSEVERKICEHLPRYMMPTAFFAMCELPLTATNKTDRKRLRQIGSSIYFSTVACRQHQDAAKHFTTGEDAISESEQPAFALAQRVFEMLPSWFQNGPESPAVDGSEQGSVTSYEDILLHSSGIDSINMMSLIHFISSTFDVRVGIKMIVDPRTSIRTLARAILELQASAAIDGLDSPREYTASTTPNTEYSFQKALDLAEEINHFDSQISAIEPQGLSGNDAMRSPKLPESVLLDTLGSKRLTVLLTGATGYIGTQILRQLLELPQVSSVIAIARGDSEHTARDRVVDSASKALWWTDLHGEKLQVWQGDLSMSHMGLDNEKWSLLSSGIAVDVIIHNGAIVHWGKSYDDLKTTNVSSTIELLEIAVSHPQTRFLYVTGGMEKTNNEEKEDDVIRELATDEAIGYSQTKYVAEAVVRRAALRHTGANIAIVCPGRVIGTTTEGVPNADDYFWRLVAACIKTGAYNADNINKWVDVSDGVTVALRIILTAFNPTEAPGALSVIKDGMRWSEFWALVRGMGYQLEAYPAMKWLEGVREDLVTEQESHPLWPVMHMLESETQDTEKSDSEGVEETPDTPLRLKVAVVKNMEFLAEIGFLPPPQSSVQELKRNVSREAFSRSSYKPI